MRRGSDKVPTIIAADLSIQGDLATDGEIHLDGKVEGDVACHALTIGHGASVAGEVTADTVRVFGEVRGRIRARNVELASKAEVHGDILHRTLRIETGAVIDGLCRHVEEPNPVAGRSVPAVAPQIKESDAPVVLVPVAGKLGG